jgi:hypothetical protein
MPNAPTTISILTCSLVTRPAASRTRLLMLLVAPIFSTFICYTHILTFASIKSSSIMTVTTMVFTVNVSDRFVTITCIISFVQETYFVIDLMILPLIRAVCLNFLLDVNND